LQTQTILTPETDDMLVYNGIIFYKSSAEGRDTWVPSLGVDDKSKLGFRSSSLTDNIDKESLKLDPRIKKYEELLGPELIKKFNNFDIMLMSAELGGGFWDTTEGHRLIDEIRKDGIFITLGIVNIDNDSELFFELPFEIKSENQESITKRAQSFHDFFAKQNGYLHPDVSKEQKTSEDVRKEISDRAENTTSKNKDIKKYLKFLKDISSKNDDYAIKKSILVEKIEKEIVRLSKMLNNKNNEDADIKIIYWMGFYVQFNLLDLNNSNDIDALIRNKNVSNYSNLFFQIRPYTDGNPKKDLTYDLRDEVRKFLDEQYLQVAPKPENKPTESPESKVPLAIPRKKDTDYDYEFKVVFSGKLDSQLFPESHNNPMYQNISLPDGTLVKLQLWDANLFPPTDTYKGYTGSHAAVLVYNTKNQASFEAIEENLSEAFRYGEKDLRKFLVGLHPAKTSEVKQEEGEEGLREFLAGQGSAKTSEMKKEDREKYAEKAGLIFSEGSTNQKLLQKIAAQCVEDRLKKKEIEKIEEQKEIEYRQVEIPKRLQQLQEAAEQLRQTLEKEQSAAQQAEQKQQVAAQSLQDAEVKTATASLSKYEKLRLEIGNLLHLGIDRQFKLIAEPGYKFNDEETKQFEKLSGSFKKDLENINANLCSDVVKLKQTIALLKGHITACRAERNKPEKDRLIEDAVSLALLRVYEPALKKFSETETLSLEEKNRVKEDTLLFPLQSEQIPPAPASVITILDVDDTSVVKQGGRENPSKSVYNDKGTSPVS